MNQILDPLLIVILAFNFFALGVSRIRAVINAAKPLAGSKANSYLIFDYVSPTDFKFAGVDVVADKVRIGQRTAAEHAGHRIGCLGRFGTDRREALHRIGDVGAQRDTHPGQLRDGRSTAALRAVSITASYSGAICAIFISCHQSNQQAALLPLGLVGLLHCRACLAAQWI